MRFSKKGPARRVGLRLKFAPGSYGIFGQDFGATERLIEMKLKVSVHFGGIADNRADHIDGIVAAAIHTYIRLRRVDDAGERGVAGHINAFAGGQAEQLEVRRVLGVIMNAVSGKIHFAADVDFKRGARSDDQLGLAAHGETTCNVQSDILPSYDNPFAAAEA